MNPETAVSIYTKTSGILHKVASTEAPTVEAAIEAIEAARAVDGITP